MQSVGVDDHKVPPNETDQVQPIDRGMGRQIKVYLGQLLDEWLDDEDNLEKWESNTLTASDRRILLAHWFYKASMKALQGEAKRKYFEHAGALLTADGSDDDKIKLESAPKDYKLEARPRHAQTIAQVHSSLMAPQHGTIKKAKSV